MRICLRNRAKTRRKEKDEEMFTRLVEFGGIELNAVLVVGIWILLSVLMVYAAVVCVGVFKAHYFNANKVWKRHCYRVWMALAITLPVLSVLKTIELAWLAVCG